MIYLDSSALIKLIFQEPESDALQGWLVDRADTPRVASELAKVEVARACHREDPAALPAARALLRQVDLVPLAGPVSDLAADLEDPALRSLDALHLASALWLGDAVTWFVAYDLQLHKAAERSGLATHQPGR